MKQQLKTLWQSELWSTLITGGLRRPVLLWASPPSWEGELFIRGHPKGAESCTIHRMDTAMNLLIRVSLWDQKTVFFQKIVIFKKLKLIRGKTLTLVPWTGRINFFPLQRAKSHIPSPAEPWCFELFRRCYLNFIKRKRTMFKYQHWTSPVFFQSPHSSYEAHTASWIPQGCMFRSSQYMEPCLFVFSWVSLPCSEQPPFCGHLLDKPQAISYPHGLA